MRVEISKTTSYNMDSTASNKKVSYSIKKLWEQLFKKRRCQKFSNSEVVKKTDSFEFLDSMERNNDDSNIRPRLQQDFLEPYKNDMEEYRTYRQSFVIEDYDFSDLDSVITMPIHLVCENEQDLHIMTSTFDIPADNDLVTPMGCCTYNQLASKQNACQ